LADPAASSRPLLFPPVAFVVLDGDGFILQVHNVFTRIRPGATLVALVAARSDLQRQWRALAAILAKVYSKWL
jgi:hypothetical protein